MTMMITMSRRGIDGRKEGCGGSGGGGGDGARGGAPSTIIIMTLLLFSTDWPTARASEFAVELQRTNCGLQFASAMGEGGVVIMIITIARLPSLPPSPLHDGRAIRVAG